MYVRIDLSTMTESFSVGMGYVFKWDVFEFEYKNFLVLKREKVATFVVEFKNGGITSFSSNEYGFYCEGVVAKWIGEITHDYLEEFFQEAFEQIKQKISEIKLYESNIPVDRFEIIEVKKMKNADNGYKIDFKVKGVNDLFSTTLNGLGKVWDVDIEPEICDKLEKMGVIKDSRWINDLFEALKEDYRLKFLLLFSPMSKN